MKSIYFIPPLIPKRNLSVGITSSSDPRVTQATYFVYDLILPPLLTLIETLDTYCGRDITLPPSLIPERH